MSWNEFIVIPNWKVIIEVQRGIQDGLMQYQKEALDKITEEFVDLLDITVKNLNVQDIGTFAKIITHTNNLFEMRKDIFLLYWLDLYKIKYKIYSELDKEYETMDKTGYFVQRLNKGK